MDAGVERDATVFLRLRKPRRRFGLRDGGSGIRGLLAMAGIVESSGWGEVKRRKSEKSVVFERRRRGVVREDILSGHGLSARKDSIADWRDVL
jgi:hypothetical protein